MRATVLSCFSGVGGLDLGLEAAGFETVGCLELDDDARSALSTNRPSWTLVAPSDVVAAGKTLKPKHLGLARRDLTLIAGGPPCQPFSKAAQWSAPKRGVMDDRGTTVGGMMKLVESFLPRAVMMENVSGFLTGANNARALIESSLARINAAHGTQYELLSWVVDAADYGVPQHRRRAIALAFRDGVLRDLVLPATHRGDHRTAWDALGANEPVDAPSTKGKYADLLPCIPEGGNYQFLTALGGGPERELFGYRTKFWSFLLKLAKDQPAWTLPANPGPSTGPFHWSNRPLTSAEGLLLQGFPPEWKLVSSERVNVRLAGNATPPPLAEAMGRLILHILSGAKRSPDANDIRPALAIKARHETPPPQKKPAPLPKRWAAQVGPKLPHPGAGRGPARHHKEQQ